MTTFSDHQSSFRRRPTVAWEKHGSLKEVSTRNRMRDFIGKSKLPIRHSSDLQSVKDTGFQLSLE